MKNRQKNIPFFEFSRNSRFCRVFNNAGFEWLQKINSSISIYATRALLGRFLFHARLRRPVLIVSIPVSPLISEVYTLKGIYDRGCSGISSFRAFSHVTKPGHHDYSTLLKTPRQNTDTARAHFCIGHPTRTRASATPLQIDIARTRVARLATTTLVRVLLDLISRALLQAVNRLTD